MIRRMIWPLVFGIGGVAILMSLGIWQVQRLAWKEGVLADIEARIAATPEALPEDPIPDRAALHARRRRKARFGGSRPRSGQPERAGGAVPRDLGPFETGGAASCSTAAPCRPKVWRPCTRGPSTSPATCTGRRRWTASRPSRPCAQHLVRPRRGRAGRASRHRAGPDHRARPVGFGRAGDAPAGRHRAAFRTIT
jgi:surfeit locus 1 family protein